MIRLRENQDGTIVLTDGEWNRSRYLHNGNYLLWGMELKLLKQLANGAKFEKVAEYNEEELRIIYKYEKALKDQDFKMRMRLKGLEAEDFRGEGGTQLKDKKYNYLIGSINRTLDNYFNTPQKERIMSQSAHNTIVDIRRQIAMSQLTLEERMKMDERDSLDSYESEGGEQYDYYTIERDYDEGYMNAREPTLKTNRLFDPLYYTQHQMMNDMSDRISTAFHPNAEVREQSGYGTREKQRDAIFNGLKSWNEQMIEDLNGVKRSIDMELGDRKFEADGGMEFAEWLMNNKPELYFSLLDEKNSPGMVRVGNIDRARSMNFAEWMMYNKPELYFSLIDEREEGFSAETFESETFASDWWSMWRGNFQNSYDQAEAIDAIGECVRADGRGDMRLHEAMKAIQTIVNRTYGIGEPVGGEDVRFEDFGAEESINPKDYIAISFLDQKGNGHPTTLLNTYDLRFGERGSTYFKALRKALDEGVKRGDYEGYKIKKTTSKPIMDADFDYETPYNNEYGYQVWLMGDKFFYGDSDIPVVEKNKYTINEGEPKFADMVYVNVIPKNKTEQPMNGLGSLFGAEESCMVCSKPPVLRTQWGHTVCGDDDCRKRAMRMISMEDVVCDCNGTMKPIGDGYYECKSCYDTQYIGDVEFGAETFEAKGIDTFTEPFAELKSGSILNKAILLGSLGAGAMIGLKLRK